MAKTGTSKLGDYGAMASPVLPKQTNYFNRRNCSDSKTSRRSTSRGSNLTTQKIQAIMSTFCPASTPHKSERSNNGASGAFLANSLNHVRHKTRNSRLRERSGTSTGDYKSRHLDHTLPDFGNFGRKGSHHPLK